jgi:hypothetical protein
MTAGGICARVLSRLLAAKSEGLTMGQRAILALSILLASCPAVSTPSHADNGLVRVEVFKAGLMAGAGIGRGVLSFQGHRYPFRIYGLSLGATAGISASRLSGYVENLYQPGDFAGSYAAVGLGGAWVLGAGVVQLKNDKGVTIALQGGRAGIEFAVNLSGISIQLECRHRSCATREISSVGHIRKRARSQHHVQCGQQRAHDHACADDLPSVVLTSAHGEAVSPSA